MLQDIQRQMGHATMELTNHLGVLLWHIFWRRLIQSIILLTI